MNGLPNLEELHLYAQFRRGRKYLTRTFAEFVLSKFPNLKHLVSLNFGLVQCKISAKNYAVELERAQVGFGPC